MPESEKSSTAFTMSAPTFVSCSACLKMSVYVEGTALVYFASSSLKAAGPYKTTLIDTGGTAR
jgi:hypothetical protein